MSFGDLYTVPPGQGNPPGLPPVDLPKVGAPPRRPLQITVTKPSTKNEDGVWGGLEDFKPSEFAAPKADTEGVWGALAEHSPEAEKEAKASHFRDVGAGEAFGRSALTGATFGLYPAIAGAMSAAKSPEDKAAADEAYKSGHFPSAASELGDLVKGLGKLGYEHLIGPALGIKTGDEGSKAYDKAREESQKALEAGREQHPVASFAGEMTGALAVPVPGLAAVAAPARIARGAAFGAAGGAAYGAGTGISKGKDAAGIAKDALIGGGLGAVTGGAFGGALGPRAAAAVPSRGQRAAETARDLGAPLPRGVASDSRALQNTTATLRQVPVLGPRIGQAVEHTQEAAGRRIEGIATHMTGGATDRAAADAVVRPGLQHVIDTNRATIDANYNGVRGAIDQGRRFIMPRTQRTLADIRQTRTAAGWPNPGQGLEQFENIASGATFNGAHRARVDAREAGNGLVPHPGYNAADYNRLTRAMTADIRDMAAAATLGAAGRPVTGAQRAATVRAFDQAETEFGRLAEQNGILRRLIDARGEGAISTLIGSAKEQGGNLRLLAQLRNSMQPADFHQVGGVLLTELGHSNATGEFSLARFVTNWDKVSDRAKAILFSPQHLRNIEDIAEMGTHIKSALKESSSSHSASFLVFLDLAKDAALLGADVMSGGLGLGTLAGAGSSAGIGVLARWLGNPATASSMAAWSRARVGMLNHPTPIRLAAFNLATRNLSHNLGVPVESILKRFTALPKAGEGDDEKPEVVREVGKHQNSPSPSK